MGTIYKTVRKQFDYMHCDDFAAYLSEMAAKGWHFKMWDKGLRFENGEPEQVTYAVEIFRKGSESNFKRDENTFEFSAYCEAAGWEFVDSKGKICVFRKADPNATPLFTPEERLENSLKEEFRILETLFCLVLSFGLAIFLGTHTSGDFIGNVFSVKTMLRDLACGIWIVAQLWCCGYGLFCKIRYTRDIKQGKELYIGSRRRKPVYVWFFDMAMLALIVVSIGCQFLIGKAVAGIFLAVALVLLIYYRFRFGTNTERTINYLYSLMLIFTILFINLPSGFLPEEEYGKELLWELPLRVTDYREVSRKLTFVEVRKECSIFGKRTEYTQWFEINERQEQGVVYAIYESESNRVLDRVWEELLNTWGLNTWGGEFVDCTKEWSALQAVKNEKSDYFVRYDGYIFMLREWEEEVVLNQEQIDIIRDKMKLR